MRNLTCCLLIATLSLFAGPTIRAWGPVSIALPDRLHFEAGDEHYWLDLSEAKHSPDHFSVYLYRAEFTDTSWQTRLLEQELTLVPGFPARSKRALVGQRQLLSWSLDRDSHGITSAFQVGGDRIAVTLTDPGARWVEVEVNGSRFTANLDDLAHTLDPAVAGAFFDLEATTAAVQGMQRALALVDSENTDGGEITLPHEDPTCAIACMTCLWSSASLASQGVVLAMAGCGGGVLCVAFLISRTAQMGSAAVACAYCLHCVIAGGGDEDDDPDCPDHCGTAESPCPVFCPCPDGSQPDAQGLCGGGQSDCDPDRPGGCPCQTTGLCP